MIKQNSKPAKIDRLPPHSPESEQGVLGCIFLSPNDVIPECINILGETIEAFYDLRHQTIYGAMMEMYEKREPIDVITLQQHLKNGNMLEDAGGIAYLSTLPDVTPSAANVSYYAETVREKHLLRRTIQVCGNAISMVYDSEGEVDVLIDQVERDIMKISQSRSKVGDKTVKEFVKEALSDIEASFQRQGAIGGISTGFHDLDKLTDGLQRGEMVVLAARPSMGKTSLAMQIAEHISIDLKLPVGVFSLEMPGRSLVKRMMGSRARVNMMRVRDGVMTEGDFPKLATAAGKISVAPLSIEARAGLSIMQMGARARRWHQQFGIKALVIDYLQLITTFGSRRKYEGRQQEVSEISAGIKNLAKDLDIPVIILCQLNRELDKDKSRKPRLSDLRESGSIEQDADFVGFLYKKPAKEDEDRDEMDSVPVNLLISKQRNGPAGVDIALIFLKSFTRFESDRKSTRLN